MLTHERIVDAVKKAVKQYLEEMLNISVDVIHAPIPQGAIIEIGKTVSIII